MSGKVQKRYDSLYTDVNSFLLTAHRENLLLRALLPLLVMQWK